MRASTPQGARAPAADAFTEELCLFVPGQLQEAIDAVCGGPDPDAPSAADVADAWRAAQPRWHELARTEAGAAEQPQVRRMPASMQAHLERLTADPGVRSTFDTVPVAFGMVAADSLVASQCTITQASVDGIAGGQPPRGALAWATRLCLPAEAPSAGARLVYCDDDEFVFEGDGHDMRYLGSQILDAATTRLTRLHGHAQTVIALAVGASTNLVNAVRWKDRIVLNNGHHRVHALRRLGFTHVPCLIQPCASFDEVRQAATSEVVDHAELYFDAPRPPLMRDFDDPQLTRAWRLPRLRRQVTVRIEVTSRLLAR
jgi:hypothetical protein